MGISMGYKMYRCKFLKETSDFIIGKDIFNENKYHIKKNEATKSFKVGTDNSFYATKEEVGVVFKKIILNAIDFEKLVTQN